ncbi:MAG: hypothetical protein GX537_10505 [Actinobacteria bacterium]|nr:hypothetical protein [Actinomycetota bacterium]
MQENCSPCEAERLQRAVLALALDRHPARIHRDEFEAELGDTPEVADAIRHLVRARLLRWEDEELALTVPALVFDRLAL